MEAVLGVVERVGVPAALLGVGAVLICRLLTHLLTQLVEAYRLRVEAAESERDYCRARSTTVDALMIRLARDLIDERRARTRGADDDEH